MTALNLDLLRKVHAMMERGATDGERTAARSRAEAIAASAGMSLEAALSKLDAGTDGTAKPGFRFTTWEDIAAEREAEARRRWQAGVAKFGHPGDLFEETERERQLREALMPLATRRKYSNSDNEYIDGFGDWRVGPPTSAVLDALERAYSLPRSLASALREFDEWEDLYQQRGRYTEPVTPLWVNARIEALAYLLNTLPVTLWDEMETRLRWSQTMLDRDCLHYRPDEQDVLDRLRADLENLRSMSVQNGRAPNGRQEPKTVGNWRRREGIAPAPL